MRRRVRTVGGLSLALLLGLATLDGRQAVLAQSESEGLAKPQRHFRVDRPANLSDADAETVYSQILDEIVAGYELSGDPTAADYRTWRRYNKAPYRSATHGERYVNNYGNDVGKVYAGFGKNGAMPQGTVLAKDSFAVTSRGDVFTGPLFVMEKMAPGFLPEARDWRYSMIMPDGSLFGQTKGPGSERVEFCITCHKAAGDDLDHLFYVPDDYRMRLLNLNN